MFTWWLVWLGFYLIRTFRYLWYPITISLVLLLPVCSLSLSFSKLLA
jgi:hypothetical protein